MHIYFSSAQRTKNYILKCTEDIKNLTVNGQQTQIKRTRFYIPEQAQQIIVENYTDISSVQFDFPTKKLCKR